MDIFSYLLGKSQGGGSSASGLDWTTLGYNVAPRNYLKMILP